MTPSIMDSSSDRKSKSFLISDILTTSVENEKSPKSLTSRLSLATSSSWSPMATPSSSSSSLIPPSSSKTFTSFSLTSPSPQSLSSSSLLTSSYLPRSPSLTFSLSSVLSLLGGVAPSYRPSQSSQLVDFNRIALPPSSTSENCQRVEPPTYLTLETTGEHLYKPLRHLRSGWACVSSHSPAASDVSTSRRKGGQVRFSCSQSCELEKRFEEQKYLSPLDRKKLAHCLELSERQVKTWFQNRRAKWRRLKEDGSSGFYRLLEASQNITRSAEKSLIVDEDNGIDVDDGDEENPPVC